MMIKQLKLLYLLLPGFLLVKPALVNRITNSESHIKDSVRVEYNLLPFPKVWALILETKHFEPERKGETGIHDYRDTVKILYNPNNVQWVHRNSKLIFNRPTTVKTVFVFTGKDNPAIDAEVSSVRYKGNYYLVFFLGMHEWEDLSPARDSSGEFVFKPIAFMVDTVRHKLVPIHYNPKIKRPSVSPKNTVIYNEMRRSEVWESGFYFSVKRKEFVFFKAK